MDIHRKLDSRLDDLVSQYSDSKPDLVVRCVITAHERLDEVRKLISRERWKIEGEIDLINAIYAQIPIGKVLKLAEEACVRRIELDSIFQIRSPQY